MVMNNELYLQQLKNEMRENGLQTKGLLLMKYRKDLTVEQEKLFNKLKEKAKIKTLELQDKFPTMLGIDTAKIHKEWINNIIKK